MRVLRLDDWEDIIAVSAGNYFTLGLKSNGSIAIASTDDSDDSYNEGLINKNDWENIVN